MSKKCRNCGKRGIDDKFWAQCPYCGGVNCLEQESSFSTVGCIIIVCLFSLCMAISIVFGTIGKIVDSFSGKKDNTTSEPTQQVFQQQNTNEYQKTNSKNNSSKENEVYNTDNIEIEEDVPVSYGYSFTEVDPEEAGILTSSESANSYEIEISEEIVEPELSRGEEKALKKAQKQAEKEAKKREKEELKEQKKREKEEMKKRQKEMKQEKNNNTTDDYLY